jgi:hypothetical protein
VTFGGARRESFLVSSYGLVEFGLDLTPDLIRAETHRAGGGQPGLFYWIGRERTGQDSNSETMNWRR